MSDIAPPLGRIASGLFILTARHGEQMTGMLASWVMQASFEPPMFTVCVQKDRFLAEWMKEGADVTLNLLGKDDKKLLGYFAKGFPPDVNPFGDVSLVEGVEGAPALADATGYLTGSVSGSLATGDHTLFAVTITEGSLLKEAEPMVHVRKNGLSY